MGMFDYVDFEMDCPKCGARVKDFQTKDLDCLMETVSPRQVSEFYGDCDACGAILYFTRKVPWQIVVEREFNLEVKGGKK